MAAEAHARIFPEPEPMIDLRCPRCGYSWHASVVLSGVWWGRGVTPQAIAALCHCPHCHAAPPMEPAPPPPLRYAVHWPYCRECGRHMSLREAAEQGLCNDCRGH